MDYIFMRANGQLGRKPKVVREPKPFVGMVIPWESESIHSYYNIEVMIMIGIYKITKKSNGKSYVGQSNDINRRFDEHKYKKELAIDQAI
jgi:hypothetical protein